MSKPYTEEDFSSQIIEDRTWRLKEISDLKVAINRADAGLRRVLLRSLIAICYAHWEGYVRFSSRKYLEHVALRRFHYRDLNLQFLMNYFLLRLSTLSTSNRSIRERCDLISDIMNAPQVRFTRANEDLINTRANLSSEVIRDICIICGMPQNMFDDKETFIDVVLLKRRNAIAHGQDTFVGIEDLETITNETIALLRTFGDCLDNIVSLKLYMSS